MIQSHVGDAFYPTRGLGAPVVLGCVRLLHDIFLNFRLSQDYCLWQSTKQEAARTYCLKFFEIEQKRNCCQNNATEELFRIDLEI